MADNSFDWQQFLVFAAQINREDSSEACLRTVVSRAYYAAYWKARRYLEKKGQVIPRQNAHDAVWLEFEFIKNSGFTPIRQLGIELKAMRTWADYDSSPPLSYKDAVTALEDAKDLIGDIDEIIKTERRDRSNN